MKKRYFKKIVFIVFLLLLAAPVFAQEINYPDFPGVQTPQEFLNNAPAEDIPGLWVKYIIALATWSAGIMAVLALVLGGIKFLISTGDPEKIVDARKRISSALLGLLIILTAYFVLNTLSPFFIDFTLPEIENLSAPNIPPLSAEGQASSIDTYVPFGRIIENIFQTYISNPEEAEQTDDGPVVPETLTRIQRITNTLDASDQLLPDIVELAGDIRDYSRDCDCWTSTRPDPEPCGGGCTPISICTGDPCEGTRGDIVETEQELLSYLFSSDEGGEGVDGIYQHDAYDISYTISTNLTTEIAKLEEEVSLLRIWFDRLARAQEFITSCDWYELNNRNQFFQKKDALEAKDWTVEDVAFYDGLEVILNVPENPTTLNQRWHPRPGTPLVEMADESTLYCARGGTLVNQPSDYILGLSPPDPFEGKEDITAEDFENAYNYELACDVTIPFGEILDKAHRTTRLLLNSMELILDREKRIIEDVGALQTLVSQCSSHPTAGLLGESLGCYSICIPPTPFTPCIPTGCHGSPCPNGEIGDRARNIAAYATEIQQAATVIRNIFTNEAIDLLQGMQDSLRNHMTTCTFEKERYGDVVFYPCYKAIGGTNEIDKTIMQCDKGTNDQWRDTLYGACMDRCYTSKIAQTPSGSATSVFENTDYRQCVSECMSSLCIYNYNHELNFHCCHIKYEI